MNKIGKKIYFDVNNGAVLVTTSEIFGKVRETTFEEDIATYNELANRTLESFKVIKLDYNQYSQDFNECISYRVNPKTYELEFSYPDDNEPLVEQPYKAPLSEQVSANGDYLLDIDFRLIMIELGLL